MQEDDRILEEVTPCTCPDADVRCPCGSLLVRRTPCGFEIKCRRCKRTLLLRTDSTDAPGRST